MTHKDEDKDKDLTPKDQDKDKDKDLKYVLKESLWTRTKINITGKNSVVHHALCFHRGTTCRWRGGQLWYRPMPPFPPPPPQWLSIMKFTFHGIISFSSIKLYLRFSVFRHFVVFCILGLCVGLFRPMI